MTTIPLLLVHGYPFDRTMWDQVIAALPAGIRTLAPDLRGFGDQPATNDEPSLDAMADDLQRLLDREEIARAVVAGFSMGGYVALAFAERHPDRLAGLGLINSSPFADTEETRASRRALIEKVRQQGPSAAAEAAIPKMFSAANAGNLDLAERVRLGAEKAGVAGIVWAQEAMARRPDRSKLVETLAVPLLVVHSLEDQFVPVERIRAWIERLPQALYVEVREAGHATPLEAPSVVARSLVDLMNRC